MCRCGPNQLSTKPQLSLPGNGARRQRICNRTFDKNGKEQPVVPIQVGLIPSEKGLTVPADSEPRLFVHG